MAEDVNNSVADADYVASLGVVAISGLMKVFLKQNFFVEKSFYALPFRLSALLWLGRRQVRRLN